VGSGKRGRQHSDDKQAATGGKRAAATPAVQAPAAFHSPFRDLAKVVKVAKPAPAPAQAVKPAAAAPPPPPPAPTEAEMLAASRTGVSRLAPAAARVVIRRRPDLSSIEAKRQLDLAELARGEGFDVTYEDRYVRGRASGVSFETLARLEKGEFPISAHLDLHGYALDDARRAVDEFLTLQHKRGRRCVLLVTGKGKNSPRGEGVLRERVPEWLARGPSSRRVLAFASARACDGGVGALVVLMRADSSSKNRIHVEHGGVGPLKT
jgi:DNA-nicking Smr family endonuclease